MTLLTQPLGTTTEAAKGIENNLLNTTLADTTKAKMASLQYADDYDYLSLAEESGLSKTNVADHQFEPILPVASNLEANTYTAQHSKSHSTEIFVVQQSSKKISTKYAPVLIVLACLLIMLFSLQAYTYLINSMVSATTFIKSIAAITPATAMTMSVKSDFKRNPPTEATTLPEKHFSDFPSIKSAGNSNPETELKTQLKTKLTNKTTTKLKFNNNVAEKVRLDKLPAKNSKHMSEPSLNDDAISNANLMTGANNNRPIKTPIKLFSHIPEKTVHPTLLDAYQALNHGEYAVAQQNYQQVLQQDMGNIDALLGMTMIAKTQGRDADAQAWNQQVLVVDPRNAIAQSLLASMEANGDAIGTESRLKNMLRQQPEAASFHAALGNLYADQNQWTAAQEAFFNACRFAPNNADYTFNLAISLDHMAQYKLALKQYQQTLALLDQSGANSPDKGLLRARIKALDSFND